MSDPQFLPKEKPGRAWRAIEEAGEFLAAMGKAGRFGMSNYNPLVPRDQRETNAAWVKRELVDLRDALNALEPDLDAEIERQKGPPA